MPKKHSSASQKYLKILGIVEIVLAALGAICVTAILLTMKPSLTDLGLTTAQITDLEKANISQDTFRTIFYIAAYVEAAFGIFIGSLLIRAANNPKKSTLALVLTVISTVCLVISLISSGLGSVSTMISSVIALTIDVLTLMALTKIRSTVKE